MRCVAIAFSSVHQSPVDPKGILFACCLPTELFGVNKIVYVRRNNFEELRLAFYLCRRENACIASCHPLSFVMKPATIIFVKAKVSSNIVSRSKSHL